MRRSLPQRAKHQPSSKPLARGNKGEPRSSSPFCIAIPPHCDMPTTSTRVGGRTNRHVALLGITNWRSRQARPRNPTSCQLRSVLSPWVPHVGARQGQHATCPNNATAPQHAPTSTRVGGRTDRHLALLGIIGGLGTPTPSSTHSLLPWDQHRPTFACGDNTLEPRLGPLAHTDHRAIAPRHATDIHLRGGRENK